MKRYYLIFCAVLCACASGGSVTTIDAFYEIPVGASTEEVIAQLGEPVSIQKCEDGAVEYEYIERFKAGSRNVNDRSYFIQMKDGKVVSKRVKQISPPAYRFNSYQMQTTQNTEEARERE